MPRSQPLTLPSQGAPPVIPAEQRADKLGSPRAGRPASRLPIPTSEVGIMTPCTHTLGVTSRPRGFPCWSRKHQEAQASLLIIIRRLSCSRGAAHEGCRLRVPEIHTTHPAPAQLAQDSQCCPLRPCQAAGSALGTGWGPLAGGRGAVLGSVVPVLGAGVTWPQARGTRQASVSLGGPWPGDPVPLVHPES